MTNKAAPASSSSTNRAKNTGQKETKPHVLIVDSSKTIFTLIEAKFEKYSWKVTHAESEPHASNLLGLSYKNALLNQGIRDVTMVVADYNSGGYELLQKIKGESSRLKDVHVVIMFSMQNPKQNPTLAQKAQKCKDAGALMSTARPLCLYEVELLMELIK